MAIMPGAAQKPISYNGVSRMSRYDVVCIHTIVGHDPANAAHFSTGSKGEITQSRDTAYQSAANYQGNYRVIAIENEDFGPEYGDWNTSNGHEVPYFTDAQCESIAKIVAWVCKTHNIPIVACPDSKPGSRGIAYHRQGIQGNWSGFAYGGWVSGGEFWSTSTGKVCPGDRRISQLFNVIIPRAKEISGGEVTYSQWSNEDKKNQAMDGWVYTWPGSDNSLGLGSTNSSGGVVPPFVILAAIDEHVNALTASVANITLGGVDYELLSNLVIDKLLAKLNLRQVDPTS